MRFDDDIRVSPAGESRWAGRVDPGYNIGTNPNGGYLLAIAAAAMRAATPAHPDPLSLTAHYLKPGLPDADCTVEVTVPRAGRSLSTVRATLAQHDGTRLELLGAMGDLGDASDSGDAADARLEPPPPAMPPPQDCVPRSPGEQGVALPILDRLEVRLHPDEARAGSAGRAQVSGWIRSRDGREPDLLAALMFTDAFPPAVFGLLGTVGWVPTVELTVQLRRRPAPGWMLAQFRTVDLVDGRLIEDGLLWDARGRLVAQSRQLALLRRAGGR